MDGLLISGDKESNFLIQKLTKKLGGRVSKVSKDQFEDFILGEEMEKVKTGKFVSRDTIFKYLESE